MRSAGKRARERAREPHSLLLFGSPWDPMSTPSFVNSSLPMWIASLCLGLAAHGPVHASEPQVEEIVVGPTNSGGAFVLAPRGARVAYAGRKDGKLVVSVNGVDGPAFDELYLTHQGSFHVPERAGVWPGTLGGNLGGDVPVTFSVDGEHYAYAGRQGAESVILHDGKEIARAPQEILKRGGGLTISPRGKHVYWAESQLVTGRSIFRRVVDGKPGPWAQPEGTMFAPVFSPDESRVAYFVGRTVDTDKPVLMVDGKDAGYAGGDPKFTADGAKLLTTAYGPGGGSVLVDGKPAVTGIQVTKVVVAPAGSSWAAIVRQLEQNKPVDKLFLDGKVVPGTDHAQDVWFSPDGRRYAALCRNPYGGPAVMVVDGKRSPEYARIDAQPPAWSPDGSKMIYTAANDQQSVVVVEGKETPYSGALLGEPSFAFASRGGRFGWGTRAGNNRVFTLLVDGEPVLPPTRIRWTAR